MAMDEYEEVPLAFPASMDVFGRRAFTEAMM